MKKKICIFVLCLSACFALTAVSHAEDFQIDSFSPFIYPGYSKKISMDFQDASLVDVLKIFSQQTNFNLITSESIANRRVTVYLDNVPVEQALEQVLRANNLIYELQPGSDIYIVKPLVKPEVELLTRVYQLKHASVSSAKIRKTLTVESSDGTSIASDGDAGIISAVEAILTPDGKIVEDPRTNSLIITDIATNFPKIEQTIAKLDIPVPLILIEVEMLEISKDTSDQIGIKHGNTPLEFRGGKRAHVYPWNQNKLLDKGLFAFDTEYTAGIIDASGFAATLNFLKTQTDTKYLARPRILTLNNQPAEIKISTDESIGKSQEITSSMQLSTSTTEAERVETGVFLTVTPQANILTGEITMAIDPKVIVARTGNTFGNETFRDPEERGSKSLLRVQSGDTVIMGGLLRQEVNKVITKVPILGDIPIIGRAFRHNNETSSERELIIFITPRIINESPLPRTVVGTAGINNETQTIVREQDVPRQRSKKVTKELSVFGKQEL